jgi:outer membrane protein assembly factor BamB
MIRPTRSPLPFLPILFLLTAPTLAENWPQFRGPTGLGYSQDQNLPLAWGGENQKNILWKSPLKGQGHASPIVWDDFVFVCTVNWPGSPSPRANVMPDHHVTCYQASDGKIKWDTLIPPGPWLRSDFRSGPGGGYAAPTPATDGKLVYCMFGSSVLAALDFQGKIVWRQDILPFTFDVTVGGSPILWQDSLILLCAMAKTSDSCAIAFDKTTGREKWRTPFPSMAFAHSTPLLLDINTRPQLLLLASGGAVKDDAVRGLDPADGKVLWTGRGAGDAASPAFGQGILYCDSGRGGPGFAIDPTGAGDVSKTHVKWTVNQIPEAIGSPIIVGSCLYRLHSPGILKCFDITTGQQLYSERLDGLTTTWASPIADANGRLYFASAGKSYVLQAGPQFKVLAVNDLADPNHPSPAAAAGKLFLIGTKDIYCIGNKP